MTNLKARWVLPVTSAPVRDGVVRIENDRILAVGQGRAGESIRDLGNVAILPGLVNAHTHLELSGIEAPLGRPGISIVDWIGLVLKARQSSCYDTRDAVRRGLDQCATAGVAAVGDIVQGNPTVTEEAVATTAFLELIGPTEDRTAEALKAASEYIGAGQGRGALRVGLSPHAPYSVRPELVEGACRLSREHRVPVAFHLAESQEELQLLAQGAGPFKNLLDRLGSWDQRVQHAGRCPLDFLKMLADADRALVVHGNYLNEEEIRFIAGQGGQMSVVYCPRTHAWFRHEPYPLESMLASGVNVALGTDSRASSPDLNLLEEMRSVAREHPGVPRERIVEMGTIGGARALGQESELGSLMPGRRARLTVVPLPSEGSNDPYELILGR